MYMYVDIKGEYFLKKNVIIYLNVYLTTTKLTHFTIYFKCYFETLKLKNSRLQNRILKTLHCTGI